MTLTELTQLLLSFFPFGFIKIGVLLLILIYLVFAAIIVRQDDLMSRVVEIPFSPLLRLVAALHFFAVILLFLLAVLLL